MMSKGKVRAAIRTVCAVVVLIAFPSLAMAQGQDKGKPDAPKHETSTQGASRKRTTSSGNKSRANSSTAARSGSTSHSHNASGTKAASRTTQHNPAFHRSGTNTPGTRGGANKPVTLRDGSRGVERFHANGTRSSIHAHGMTLNYGAHGERTIVTRRPDGSRLVSVGPGRGYVERPFMRGGHPYMQRTYVYGGRTYVNVYRGYSWHGGIYYGYMPHYYYGHNFYGWAYSPWGAPVVWGWGWGPAPWYGYNAYYFAPAPVYPYPALWITDYLLATNLQAAYDARVAANAAAAAPPAPPPSASGDNVQPSSGQSTATGSANPVVLTPEVKQEIADEVKAQVAAERDAAANTNTQPATASTAGDAPPPAALDPAQRTFIVSTALNEQPTTGADCSLTAGDVLTRIDDAPDAKHNVTVLVTTSQKGDCASGTRVAIGVQDLQDMHNHFQEQVDDGLAKLADSSGKNGLPAAPEPSPTPVADAQAKPDPTAAADLQAQQQNANTTETEVQSAAKSNPPSGN